MRRSNARRTARTTDGTRAPARPLWLSRGLLLRTAQVTLWLGSLAGIVYGVNCLEAYAARVTETPPCRLEWDELPPWLADPAQHEVLADIAAAAGLRPDDDLREPKLCERIAKGLIASPWVLEVARVAKRPDGAVRIRATFRKPLTMIISNGMAYLVDEGAVRLPPYERAAYLKPDDWIVVTGARGSVPPLGHAWSGEDVQAGLKLVKYLHEAEGAGLLPFRGLLRTVDVGNYELREDPRAGCLRIRTISGGEIRWGLPLGEEDAIECAAGRKLEMLRTLYVRTGQFPDAPWIDVRDGRGIRFPAGAN